MIDEAATMAAIRRLAATPDGRMLRLFLQRRLMELGPVGNDGALQAFEGGRTFARRLIVLMDEGAPEASSDGSGEHVDIARRQPVATARSRGLDRRVGPIEPGPGDD